MSSRLMRGIWHTSPTLGILCQVANTSGLKYFCVGRLRSSQHGPSDFFDMHIVRAATPAKDIHFRMSRLDINVLARQFIRITFFEMAQLAQGTMIQR